MTAALHDSWLVERTRSGPQSTDSVTLIETDFSLILMYHDTLQNPQLTAYEPRPGSEWHTICYALGPAYAGSESYNRCLTTSPGAAAGRSSRTSGSLGWLAYSWLTRLSGKETQQLFSLVNRTVSELSLDSAGCISKAK